MIGIKQLAQHLQISIGTVSRALNGRPDVNEETRQRVLEAAKLLGYMPNHSGRSLRQGSTNTIGFMMETSPDTAANNDNFFLGVIDGLQGALARHRLDLILMPCATDEDPHSYLERIAARRLVDAMIITAVQRNDRRIDFLMQAQIPFVTLGRSSIEEITPGLILILKVWPCALSTGLSPRATGASLQPFRPTTSIWVLCFSTATRRR